MCTAFASCSSPVRACFTPLVENHALLLSCSQPIGAENRGFRLLTNMGWKVGQGLGAKGDGITVPVVLRSQVASLGLGKSAEDDK